MGKKKIVNTFLTPAGAEEWRGHLDTTRLTRAEHGALQWPNHRRSLLDWLTGIGKLLHNPSIALDLTDKRTLEKIEMLCGHQRWTTVKRDDLSMMTELIVREMGERVDYLQGVVREHPTKDMTKVTAWAELKTLAAQVRYTLLTLQEMLRVAPSRGGQDFLRRVIDSLIRDVQDMTGFIRTYRAP